VSQTTSQAPRLNRTQKRKLMVLGLPTLVLSLSITLVSTYLPVVLQRFSHSTSVIGLIVGGEGIFALSLSLVAGVWSDQLETRFGGRLPFILGGSPLIVVALVAIGFANSVELIVAAVVVFFAGYFLMYEPYRALYPDVMEAEVSGRAQGTQALWRGAGTGFALVGGGLLLSVARPLPFVVAAVIALAALGAFVGLLVSTIGVPQQKHVRLSNFSDARGEITGLLKQHPALRAFMLANVLWELSLAALKSFVVLFITVGLGYSLTTAALLIGVVALVILIAAPVSGRLGDRYGTGRVMLAALAVYALGLLVPFFSQTPAVVLPVLPVIAFGGGVIMTLPYALLMPMMPAKEHGAVTGLYSVSRGLGTLLGPLIGGVVIELSGSLFPHTHGYVAMWLVSSAAIAASIPLLSRLLFALRRDWRNLQRA
jgi:MFS family permease